jgi:hypothetical protein
MRWRHVNLADRRITVAVSKTTAGEWREVDLLPQPGDVLGVKSALHDGQNLLYPAIEEQFAAAVAS